MPTEAHNEGFFKGRRGSNPYRFHRGRTGGPERSIRTVEDGQPNDRLSRDRDDIPSIRPAHRPYHHARKRETSVSHSRRTDYNPFFPGKKDNPPTGPRALSFTNAPSGPATKRPFIPPLDDLAPRKRRRTKSPPPITPNTHAHPASSTSANYEDSLPRVTATRSRAVAADAAVRCGPSPLDSSVNAKRESSPVIIDMLDSRPSPPLFEKLGLPEKTSGSYHVAMVDQCRKGAISYMEHRQEWKGDIINAVRFVRGHDLPPLTIERCFIRSDGMTIDWSVPYGATSTNHAIGNGSGATTVPAPTFHPSIVSSPPQVVGRAASPPIRRLAPLPTSAPTRPVESLLVDPSNLDKVPVETIEPSTRSTTKSLPKGIAKDALPVKVIDVPEYLLGEDMRKDRYDWRSRLIIGLGNPNYKGAFALTREKGPEGKWRIAGLELHIYDAGEKDSPALPKEIPLEFLKEKGVNSTRSTNQSTGKPFEDNSADTPIPNEQTKSSTHCDDTLSSVLESLAHQRSSLSALVSRPSVYQENTTERNRAPASRERNSAQQLAPQFRSSTVSAAKETSTSAVQSKQHVSNRKEYTSPASFATTVPLSNSPEAHLPRTVAPMRPSRSTRLPEEPVLLSAGISAPLIIKAEPESQPLPGSPPEAVLSQPSSRAATQSVPTYSLQRVRFDSSFCSGPNAIESLSEIVRGFLRRFFGYLDSTEKAGISDGYSEEAVMSWQLNDLPSVGVCPQVGNPQAQGHQIKEVPRWVARNLLLQGPSTRRLAYGKTNIVERLETMADLKLTPSPDCDPEYEYEALDLGIRGLVQVRCWGNLHKMVDDESHIALRFERTFILEKNYGAAKFLWPWVIISDQMTLFHRPGILCQCLGGRRTQSSSTLRA